jgi:hypothetical protein
VGGGLQEAGIDQGGLFLDWIVGVSEELFLPAAGTGAVLAEEVHGVPVLRLSGSSDDDHYHFMGRFLALALNRGVAVNVVLALPLCQQLVHQGVAGMSDRVRAWGGGTSSGDGGSGDGGAGSDSASAAATAVVGAAANQSDTSSGSAGWEPEANDFQWINSGEHRYLTEQIKEREAGNGLLSDELVDVRFVYTCWEAAGAVEVELLPGGANQAVTVGTAATYMRLVAAHEFGTRVRSATQAVRAGLHQVLNTAIADTLRGPDG